MRLRCSRRRRRSRGGCGCGDRSLRRSSPSVRAHPGEENEGMVKQADVVVIGSGGLGAATAFYLVQRGAGHVALLDKHDLGSQTSPRAAGMAAHARSSDLMVEVM